MPSDKNAALIRLHQSRDSAFGKLAYLGHSTEEKTFLHVWELEAEVNNGGFEQYFCNSSGNHASEVVASLKAIGAHKAAAIAQKAISIAFGASTPSVNRDLRTSQVKALNDNARDQLAECDQAFFKYPDNLTELLFSFVAEHRKAIRGAEGI